MCTSFSVVKADFFKTFYRSGIVDRAVQVEKSTVSMRRVCAEANLAGNVERREDFAEFLDSKNDGAGGVVGQITTFVLVARESISSEL